ncbi:YihY/virulence factor BrkB family protein [Nakamurella leprariae]|uniref:YihY/virulence factor BrkB family protein n=1 Tax=Nakamurella leprariae TaxID=2803911 RepID=A0A938YA64_9ACTN|nr:YihY/virulence factor BrkB family protein [Nakamurella leprariae]MBM9466817.1 YihY/virulence factor BrkB family protein [Nakamurella leprariae]
MSEDAGASRARTAAPQPEDGDKPDKPTDLRPATRRYLVRKVVREFSADQCTDLAAALTYYAVLALFPGLLALVSLVGLFGQGRTTVDALLGVVEQVGGSSLVDSLRAPVQSLVDAPAAGFAFVIGLVGALWSASGYVGAFSRAMNRVYEIDEGRPFWKLRPLMLLITLIAVIMAAAVGLALVLSGPIAQSVGDAIGLGSTAVTVWNIAKWPVMLIMVVLVVAILYYATPNVRQPKFRWISLGAAIAILVWIVASVLFGLYVANFANYQKTYGSLAGVIVFLLWLWITNLALLFGAEVDAELERARQLQAGIRAERDIQLPPRDTRASDKAAAKEAEDERRGRKLRRTRGADQHPEPRR